METAAFSSGISTPATRNQNTWYIWNLFTEHSYTKDGKSLVTVTEILKLLNRGTVQKDPMPRLPDNSRLDSTELHHSCNTNIL